MRQLKVPGGGRQPDSGSGHTRRGIDEHQLCAVLQGDRQPPATRVDYDSFRRSSNPDDPANRIALHRSGGPRLSGAWGKRLLTPSRCLQRSTVVSTCHTAAAAKARAADDECERQCRASRRPHRLTRLSRHPEADTRHVVTRQARRSAACWGLKRSRCSIPLDWNPLRGSPQGMEAPLETVCAKRAEAYAEAAHSQPASAATSAAAFGRSFAALRRAPCTSRPECPGEAAGVTPPAWP